MTNLISPAYTESDSSIPAIPPGVRLVTLQNGLTLIIREDHSAPVVSAQAWCKAGSIDEGKWLGAGLSHVLEHMLFKGTTTRPGSRIDQEVQEAGGYMNAYTSFDRTVSFPRRVVPLVTENPCSESGMARNEARAIYASPYPRYKRSPQERRTCRPSAGSWRAGRRGARRSPRRRG